MCVLLFLFHGLWTLLLLARPGLSLSPRASCTLSFDHGGGLWVFLVCSSPLKGLFVMETGRYKSFTNFSLLLSTTKHVQFSSNNKTLIHLCLYFLFSTAQVFSVLRLNLSGPSSCLPADVFIAETESPCFLLVPFVLV